MFQMRSQVISNTLRLYILSFLLFFPAAGLTAHFLLHWGKPASFLGGVLAGLTAAAIAASWLSRRVEKRVKRILDFLARSGEGNFHQKIYLDGTDEFQKIAGGLNSLGSALKHKFQELAEERKNLSVVLEHMAEGVIAFDERRRILLMNPAAGVLFNVDRNKIREKSVLEVTRSEKIEEMARRSILGKSVVTEEMEITQEKEMILKIQAIGIPEEEGAGVVGGILVFYDMTEIRNLEKMRKEFVANVSHELKTPLTSIKGFIETLLSGTYKNPGQSEAFLKMMEQDSDRLTRLIDDLLELSRVESKKVQLKLETLSLNQEAAKSLLLCQRLIEEKSLKLENHITEENDFSVRADADKLQQIFINLIDNAVKFNRVNGRIILRAEKVHSFVKISVEDTGCGIPQKDLSRIFERFYRVDKARSRALGGTGLGLAIVKHLVEAHGGDVSCQSTVEKGSIFSFTLPRAGA